jgi:hypothetical protein
MVVAILLLACLLLAGAVVALAVALRRLGGRLADLESRTRVQEVAPQPSRDHRDQVAGDGVETGASPSASTDVGNEYVITRLGDVPDEPVAMIEGRLFADVVLRESVVKAASWAHGLRQGLSPANRNRIWFEMRREVKRARKERKAEEREAIREYRARRRAGVGQQEESAA